MTRKTKNKGKGRVEGNKWIPPEEDRDVPYFGEIPPDEVEAVANQEILGIDQHTALNAAHNDPAAFLDRLPQKSVYEEMDRWLGDKLEKVGNPIYTNQQVLLREYRALIMPVFKEYMGFLAPPVDFNDKRVHTALALAEMVTMHDPAKISYALKRLQDQYISKQVDIHHEVAGDVTLRIDEMFKQVEIVQQNALEAGDVEQ